MSGLVLYTAAEVADVLRLNPQVVQRKLQAGEIPGYRLGREWRVEEAQLRSWLEQHSNQRPGLADGTAAWFTADGKLRAIPKQQKKRDAIFRRLIEEFEPDRTYTERQVSAILRRFHDDTATIRRELVGMRLFVRTRDGVYKRTAPRSVSRTQS
jgi:excisionase family DNA binding protein